MKGDMDSQKEEGLSVYPKEDENVPLHIPENVPVSELQYINGETEEEEEKEEEKENEEEEKREIWDSKWDYIMSMFGYAVGVSNIWRFPYMCYKNGGGAFLIPYLLMMIFLGMPMFLLESAMGQFSSSGALTIYSICPALKGSGYVSVLWNILCYGYASLIMTYSLIFLYHSFSSEVPWGSCDNSWNTPNCYLVSSENATIHNSSNQLTSSADEFFHRKILEISSFIGENGSLVWHIYGTDIVVWIIVFLCIFKGIKVTGKVVWFTALFPIVMLLILLVRGLFLPGASNGLYYYLYPDFEKLKDVQVWGAAAIQILYSLGPGWGGVIVMGSYNKFNNNCMKDAVLLPILNSTVSILAGFVVFSVLGFMAHEMGTTVDKVTAAGPALVFVAYPEALSMMPMAPVWSALFFTMLFFVGLDSCFVSMEVAVASILDQFSTLRKWRSWITMAVCISTFLISTACCTQGGMYVLQLMDWYASIFTPLSVCLCEIFIFSYCYGVGRTLRDIQMMTKEHVNYWWYICLLIITPVIMMVMFMKQSISFTPGNYNGVPFPPWAHITGSILAFSSTIFILIYLISYFFLSKGSLEKRIATCFSPSAEWGPASARNRNQWEEYIREKPLRHRLLHPDSSPTSEMSFLEIIPTSSSSFCGQPTHV